MIKSDKHDPQLPQQNILHHNWLKHQEFFYSWLAPTLVDRFSTCSREHEAFSCEFDAYPLVAVGLTLVTLIFLITQWKRGDISGVVLKFTIGPGPF